MYSTSVCTSGIWITFPSSKARPIAVPRLGSTGKFGLGAPKKTPVEIVDKLNRAINAALDDPKLKTRLVDLGGTLLVGSPADFSKLIADDTEKWGKVIRAANIKAE